MPNDARTSAAAPKDQPPRGWVVRLGSYLRIFGTPDATEATTAWDGRDELDGMIDLAKEREDEHGC